MPYNVDRALKVFDISLSYMRITGFLAETANLLSFATPASLESRSSLRRSPRWRLRPQLADRLVSSGVVNFPATTTEN